MLEKYLPRADLSGAGEDAPRSHAKKTDDGEVQCSAILWACLCIETRKHSRIRCNNAKVRIVFHQHWHLYHRGEAENYRIPMSLQKSISANENSSNRSPEFPRRFDIRWRGRHDYRRDSLSCSESHRWWQNQRIHFLPAQQACSVKTDESIPSSEFELRLKINQKWS